MWVWRLAGKTDWFFENSNNPNYARLWQCREFEISELFNHQRLRQGWGVPELDLNLTRTEWVRKRFELGINDGISMRKAEDDYTIMIPMRTEIRVQDTIFLPMVGNNQRSVNHFVVVTVAEAYRFENRGQYPKPSWYDYSWDQDYGHIIPINGNLTRTFPYGLNTLEGGAFGAPFIKRLNRVPSAEYRGFDAFLQRHNYPFNPY